MRRGGLGDWPPCQGDAARRRRSRGTAIALGVVAVIGVGALVALLGPRPESSPTSGGSSQAAVATSVPPRPGPTGTTSTLPSSSPAKPPSGPGNVALAGAPELVFFERAGDDLDVLGWRAGEGTLGVRQVIAGALRGIANQQSYGVALSSDGSIVLVQAAPATHGAPITFRAFRLGATEGARIWESTALGSEVVGSFVGPAHVVVAPASQIATGRAWTLIDLSGKVAETHELAQPPIVRPSPGASLNLDTLTFNIVPFATSADGTYLYALSTHGTEPIYRPAYRIWIATGKAEAVDAFPTTGNSRVVSPIVDTKSGRFLLAGARSTSGPGLVQAWSPGAREPEIEVELHNVFGAQWFGDGRIVTGDYDRLPGPFTFQVITVQKSGEPDSPLFSAQGTDAALLGVRDGFAAAYATSRGSNVRTLVVIRLTDGATSTVVVPEPANLVGYPGLRP
jgi:hypothetical protein